MDVIVLRGTPDEVIRVMRQLGLQNGQSVVSSESSEDPAMAGLNRESVDAFLRVLTEQQRTVVVTLAKGAIDRDELMRKLRTDSTKQVQVLLAAIQRKAHGILGRDVRVVQIQQLPTGGYRYQLEGSLAQKIRE